jgi:tRNA nucleotidyltransferase (CCA-adding enzyme)
MSRTALTAQDVMVKEVYTIGPNQKVALARLQMLRHGVGALPVLDSDGSLLGIVTLRDIDLAGHDIADMRIEELMSRNLVTCAPETPLRRIADDMVKSGIQRIPVVNGRGKLVGLVTQTTLIKGARRFL